MRTEGLETDRYPSATFQVTEPVIIPAAAVDGAPADLALMGDLTPGSLTFQLADFEITAPNVGGFIVSIADEGTLEFLLILARD